MEAKMKTLLKSLAIAAALAATVIPAKALDTNNPPFAPYASPEPLPRPALMGMAWTEICLQVAPSSVSSDVERAYRELLPYDPAKIRVSIGNDIIATTTADVKKANDAFIAAGAETRTTVAERLSLTCQLNAKTRSRQ
jgi:hypothetical protein